MYKRQEGPLTVRRKTTIHVPQDGDGFVKRVMVLHFEIKPREEIQELQDKFDAGDPDTDWLNDVIKGWEQYTEADGKTPVEFTPEELKLWLDVPYNRIAAITEYFNTANGGLGRRKNS